MNKQNCLLKRLLVKIIKASIKPAFEIIPKKSLE